MLKPYFRRIRALTQKSAPLRNAWKEENPVDSSLTTVIGTGWLLAAVAGVTLFSIQFIPMILYLVQGIHGLPLLWVAPVLFIFGFCFLTMVVILLGGGGVALLTGVGALTVIILKKLFHRTKEGEKELWNVVFDSMGGALLLMVPLFYLILQKYAGLPFYLFPIITAITIVGIFLFALRVWSHALGFSFLLTVPALLEGIPILVLFWKVLPKLTPWIT